MSALNLLVATLPALIPITTFFLYGASENAFTATRKTFDTVSSWFALIINLMYVVKIYRAYSRSTTSNYILKIYISYF